MFVLIISVTDRTEAENETYKPGCLPQKVSLSQIITKSYLSPGNRLMFKNTIYSVHVTILVFEVVCRAIDYVRMLSDR